jgi:RND family efflux transporter MFP subunit
MDSTQLSDPPEYKSRPGNAPAKANGDSAEFHSGPGRASGHQFTDDPNVEHDRIDLNVPAARKGWLVALAVGIVLAVTVLLLVGVLPRVRAERILRADANAQASTALPVSVITPVRAPAVIELRVPATLRPWQEVSIFSRTTGYLKKYNVDISEQVTKGQLMATIDTPEVDAQLRGAQATLQQEEAAQAKAKTDFEFAKSTLQRYEQLQKTNSVTQQELASYQANFNAAQSTLRSAAANVAVGNAEVKRLSDMQSFEKLVAPFSGVVTGRAYDVGAMILANPTTADTMPLFKIAENDVLRAFVYVPQTYSLTIQKGMEVKLTVRERPNRVFTGSVMGTTNYLDPAARSLMTEVKVSNTDFALLPGMYVEAIFQVKRESPPLIIPAAALVAGADGNKVGVVTDGKLHFRKVQVGVDSGNTIEIVSGLKGDEQIVGNPGEKTIEGASVRISGAESAPTPTTSPTSIK